jgi:hypothetical protein
MALGIDQRRQFIVGSESPNSDGIGGIVSRRRRRRRVRGVGGCRRDTCRTIATVLVIRVGIKAVDLVIGVGMRIASGITTR